MIVLSLYIIFLYVTLLTYQQMVRTSHKHYCAEKGEKDFKKTLLLCMCGFLFFVQI